MIKMAIVDFGGTGVDPASLPPIAAAATAAAQNHFALPPPYGYGLGATIRVAANPNPAFIGADEWVVGLVANADVPGALGYHDQTPHGQPFMKVFPILDRQDGGILSVTITHEIWETLADPNVARAAQAPDGRFWAYEVSDAVEETHYSVNGVPISNFVLPPYFEHVANMTGLKFDHMGLVKKMLAILPGGYGQYFDPRQGWVSVEHQTKGQRAYRKQVDGRSRRRATRGYTLLTDLTPAKPEPPKLEEPKTEGAAQ